MPAEVAPVTGLRTLQFHFGGLMNTVGVGDIHLVRSTRTGTPGPTLCGIDRFDKNAPGWSVGGGVNDPAETYEPCEGCRSVAAQEFDGLPVGGMFARLFDLGGGNGER